MNFTNLLKIGESLTENSTFSERAIVGAQVVAIGMGVVFGVLIILIAILQVFKLVFVKKPKSKVQEAEAVPVSTSAVSAAPASEEEAVVAVASAAIAASRGESECNFNIISIKKIVK